MTDFPTQNSSELLTPMNPEISPSYDFNMTKPAKNVTYSNFSCLSNIFVKLFLLLYLLQLDVLFYFFINNYMKSGDTSTLFYGNFFVISIFFGYTYGSLQTIYDKIHINNSVGIITITHVKLFCCFSISVKIQINKIKKVYVKIIEEKNDDNNNVYKNFVIVFRLLNGKEIRELNSYGKVGCREAFNIIKSVLPENIIFNDDLLSESTQTS